MKLKISQKLLVLFLLLTGMVAGFILLLSSYSITTGFSSYVAQTELASLDTMPYLLVSMYEKNGSWQKVFRDPDIMNKLFVLNEDVHRPHTEEEIIDGDRPDSSLIGEASFDPNSPGELNPEAMLLNENMKGKWTRLRGDNSPPKPFEGPYPRQLHNKLPLLSSKPRPPEGRADPPPFPPFRVELFHRIGVFNKDGVLLWGTARAKNSRAVIPLILNDVSIGSFRVAVSETLNREMESNFLTEQSRTMLFVCLFAVVLAAVSAKLMSKHFIEAIDSLVQCTRKLIAGDWSTRINLVRSDELGQLAHDLNTLASVLEQHDRAHKQWITDTSHELRTPVAVLRAQVEALQDGVQEPNQRTLSVLHEQVMILGKLIDDLHDLAKYDVNQLRFRLVPTDVAAVIQEGLESFAERFEKKSIKVDVGNLSELNCILPADPARLKQLFGNLLENSLRYTDDAGKLSLSTSVDENFLSISFDDSEPGVPEDLLSHIFERFYRVESSRSRIFGGTGLGLAICKTIADGHGGSISAEQSSLGGLRVELKLPLKADGKNEQGK